jgi:hypothetical protein
MCTTQDPSTNTIDSSIFGWEFGSLHVTNAIGPCKMVAIGVSNADASALVCGAWLLGDVVINPVTVPHPNSLPVVTIIVLTDLIFFG